MAQKQAFMRVEIKTMCALTGMSSKKLALWKKIHMPPKDAKNVISESLSLKSMACRDMNFVPEVISHRQ